MSSPIVLCFGGTRLLLSALCFGCFFLREQRRSREGATVWQGQCDHLDSSVLGCYMHNSLPPLGLLNPVSSTSSFRTGAMTVHIS